MSRKMNKIEFLRVKKGQKTKIADFFCILEQRKWGEKRGQESVQDEK